MDFTKRPKISALNAKHWHQDHAYLSKTTEHLVINYVNRLMNLNEYDKQKLLN